MSNKPLPAVPYLKIPEGAEPYLEGQKCGQCGWRCYCGAECQRKDWKQMGHRHVCKAIVGVRRREVHLVELIKADRVEEVRGLVLSGSVGINDM